MIRVDGSNDIVDIIWEGGDQTMNVRSNAGERSKDIFLLSKIIAILWIESVEKDRDKQSFIEPMMQGNYKINDK